jgi:hypothetical protein
MAGLLCALVGTCEVVRDFEGGQGCDYVDRLFRALNGRVEKKKGARWQCK